MSHIKQILPIFALLFLLLQSCEKELSTENGITPTSPTTDSTDTITNNANLYIDSVIFEYGGFANTSFNQPAYATFDYDGLKRVVQIKNKIFDYDGTTNTAKWVTSYAILFYTGNTLLPYKAEVVDSINTFITPPTVDKYTTYFTYNSAGKKIQDSTLEISGFSHFLPLITVRKHQYNSTLILSQSYQYSVNTTTGSLTYNGLKDLDSIFTSSSGNILTHIHYWYTPPPNQTLDQENHYVTHYQYDIKRSPFANLNIFAASQPSSRLFGDDGFIQPGVNNYTQQTLEDYWFGFLDPDDTIVYNYTYTYNSSGLPINCKVYETSLYIPNNAHVGTVKCIYKNL